jgi:hypothetical protein
MLDANTIRIVSGLLAVVLLCVIIWRRKRAATE